MHLGLRRPVEPSKVTLLSNLVEQPSYREQLPPIGVCAAFRGEVGDHRQAPGEQDGVTQQPHHKVIEIGLYTRTLFWAALTRRFQLRVRSVRVPETRTQRTRSPQESLRAPLAAGGLNHH